MSPADTSTGTAGGQGGAGLPADSMSYTLPVGSTAPSRTGSHLPTIDKLRRQYAPEPVGHCMG